MHQHPQSFFFFFFLLLIFSFFFSTATTTSLSTDIESLLSFRSAADSSGHLSSWNLSSSSNPCSPWLGVSCSSSNRINRLVLENLSLSSPSHSFFPSLLLLDQLRVLSLKSNNLSGPIPPGISNLKALKFLFLSHNSFSGPIPPSVSSLSRLYRLDLSFNNLSGLIPNSLNKLSHLLTLRLQVNSFSGSITGISLRGVKDLNFSSNDLSGAIPNSLADLPVESFGGNKGLCGFPLASCSNVVSEPSRRFNSSSPVTIVSSPSSKPEASSPPFENLKKTNGRGGGISRVAVVAIVVGDFVVLVFVSGLLFCYFWRKFDGRNPSRLHEGEKIVYSSTPYVAAGAAAGGGVFERGKMVFFDEAKKFELEDLLRASAEMLGKGGCGTAYKAVLDDGSIVAVKRLRDVQFAGKRDFEQHMEILGRLRHPNLVSLKAYYFARDEKLLVYKPSSPSIKRNTSKKMQQHPQSFFFFFLLLLLIFSFFFSTATTTSLSSDIESLLSFRSAADSSGHLSSWNLSSSSNPCSPWLGVSCSSSNRINRLVLENLSLSSPSHSFFPSLLLLDQLRVLSLKSNNLSGPIQQAK